MLEGIIPPIGHLFQFHKGTIKTGVTKHGGETEAFQFHKGTIKTAHENE